MRWKIIIPVVAVLMTTVSMAPGIHSEEAVLESLKEDARNYLDNLDFKLSQGMSLKDLDTILNQLSNSKQCIETEIDTANQDDEKEVDFETYKIYADLSEEISWLNWVKSQMMLGSAKEELPPEPPNPLPLNIGDHTYYPRFGHKKKDSGGLWGVANAWVQPSLSGTGYAGSFADATGFNPWAWAYTQLYCAVRFTGSPTVVDITFKGGFEGDLFAGGVFGLANSEITLQKWIIDYIGLKVTRINFFNQVCSGGCSISYDESFNEHIYNYGLKEDYVYSFGVKLKAEAEALLNGAHSDFGEGGDQWYLRYIQFDW